MKTAYLDVDGDWGIIVVYKYNILDYDELAAIMDTFNMSERSIKKALRILSEPNTGMCVSNSDIRMSVIFISNATSTSEWWSSALHELRHAAQAIIEYYDADLGEEDAYLTGFLTKELVELVGEPCLD